MRLVSKTRATTKREDVARRAARTPVADGLEHDRERDDEVERLQELECAEQRDLGGRPDEHSGTGCKRRVIRESRSADVQKHRNDVADSDHTAEEQARNQDRRNGEYRNSEACMCTIDPSGANTSAKLPPTAVSPTRVHITTIGQQMGGAAGIGCGSPHSNSRSESLHRSSRHGPQQGMCRGQIQVSSEPLTTRKAQ
ncbi:MAG: hypothetical protein ABJE66_21350 [Deltaproteobacteria bacterium]